MTEEGQDNGVTDLAAACLLLVILLIAAVITAGVLHSDKNKLKAKIVELKEHVAELQEAVRDEKMETGRLRFYLRNPQQTTGRVQQ